RCSAAPDHFLAGDDTGAPAASSQSLTSAAMSSSACPRALASRKRCSATEPRRSGTFAAFASSWMTPRSLSKRRTGVAGAEAREVARHHRRAAEGRPDHLEQDLRVGAEPRAEDRRLGDGRGVHADEELVDELDGLAGSRRAAEADVLPEGAKDRQRAIERRL